MMRRTGFTLIELLVVIAIIAILAAVLFPVFARAREKSREASCLSNVKQITLAILMYCDDFDGCFPQNYYRMAVRTPPCNWNLYWPWLVMPYINYGDARTGPGFFTCPSFQSEFNKWAMLDWICGAYSHYGMSYYVTQRGRSKKGKLVEVNLPAETGLIAETQYYSAAYQGFQGYWMWYEPWVFDEVNQPDRTKRYNRYDHNGRMNIGYCDGHAKGGTIGHHLAGLNRNP